MITVLTNVDVDDLDAGIRFYSQALGLRLGRRLFGGTVAEMLGAPGPIHLLARPPGPRDRAEAGTTRDYRRHWTPIHLDFVVEEIGAAVARARAAGAALEGEVRTYAWGKLASMSDPFGHGLCLLELVGRGYDDPAAS